MRDYNFFEYFSNEKKSAEFKLIYIGIISGIIVASMLITFIWTVIKINLLNKEIFNDEKIINSPKLKNALVEKGKLDRKIKLLNEYNKTIGIINNIAVENDKVNAGLLKSISQEIPSKVSFVTLSIKNDRSEVANNDNNENNKNNNNSKDKIENNKINIDITGNSEDRVSVAEFVHNLKNTGLFDKIHLSSVNLGKEEQQQNNAGDSADIINVKEETTIPKGTFYTFKIMGTLKEEHIDEAK